MGTNVISGFTGEYRWLSNFYSAQILYRGCIYPTVEHAYQAAKCVYENDRFSIQIAKTPGEAKRLGKKIDCRANWNKKKLGVMRELLYRKFSEKNLRGMLLRTGKKRLIEENSWKDTFWGKCNGEGENHLGKLLMEVREELRVQYAGK